MTIAEKLVKVADNVHKVYDTGHEIGFNTGYDDGQKAEYDRFWDGFQQNGTRTDYQQAFRGWKNAHNYWEPKHTLNITNANFMFYGFESELGLPELCEQAGITLDFSKVTTFGQPFSYAKIPDIGVVDTTSAASLGSILAQSIVEKVTLILKNDGSQHTLTGAFSYAEKLTDLTIKGTIGNTVDLHWSKNLSTESLRSIINALGGTASATLTLPSKFNTDEYADIIEGKPSNWTISYL